MVKGKLLELSVEVDGEKVVETSRLWYPLPSSLARKTREFLSKTGPLALVFLLLVALWVFAEKQAVNASAEHFELTAIKNTAVTTQDKPGPCPDALTQLEINRCAAEQFRKADKLLNVAYKRIMSELSSADRANLIAAQRAWLKYRSSNCWALRQLHSGSLAPTDEAFCLQDLTEARTRELIEIYEPPEK